MTKKRRKSRPPTIKDLVDHFVFHHISNDRITSSHTIEKELTLLLTSFKRRIQRNRKQITNHGNTKT